MSTFRLLLVTDAVGGVWVYSLELARALRPMGIETILAIVGPSPDGQQLDELGELPFVDTGLPLEWLDTSPAEIARASTVLAALARDEGADIVQTSTAALLADADFRQPCIAVQHSCLASWWEAVKGTDLPPEFQWRRELVGRGLGRAAAIIAPSVAFAAETARVYGLAASAVHNGRSRQWSREIPRGEFVFTAGRLWDEGKNVATLDAAASAISAPFQAAGPLEGPNGARANLRNIDPLGVLGETRLAGVRAARPIYASASLYEPFGLSVLEAAQAGSALVLSDISTHRELWDGAAIFVAPTDARGFAIAIQDLLDDADEREQLGRMAAARSTHYTPARMARGMAEVYSRVVQGSGAAIEFAGAA